MLQAKFYPNTKNVQFILSEEAKRWCIKSTGDEEVQDIPISI